MKTNNLVSPYIKPHAAVHVEEEWASTGWDKLHFLVFIHLSFLFTFYWVSFLWTRQNEKEMLWHEEKWNKKQLQTQIDELGKLLFFLDYFLIFLLPLRLTSNLYPFFSAIFHTINKNDEDGKKAIKLHKSTAIACLFLY